MNGYLYIASNEKYSTEAQASVKSLKKTNPQAHATLITQQDMDIEGFDEVRKIDAEPVGDDWKKGLKFRLEGLRSSPYEKTFYVDSDTFFCDSCDELFDLLDYFDLLICPAPIGKQLVTFNGKPMEGYFGYNAGVLVFNSNEVIETLFDKWQQIYAEKFTEYKNDQPALMEALLSSPVNTYALQSIYNFRIPFIVSAIPAKVKIIHGRHKDLPSLARDINKDPDNRVWIPALGKVITRGSKGLLTQLKGLFGD